MRNKRRATAAVITVTGLILIFQNCAQFEPMGPVTSTLSSSGVPTPYVPPAPLPPLTTWPAGTFELITDPLVKTGFQETDACPNVSDTITAAGCATNVQRNVSNILWPAYAGQSPLWTLQQWGSRMSIPGGVGTAYGDGLVWADATKHLAIFPGGVIEMGVNGLVDWNGSYAQDQPARPGWPSMTLGFNVNNPGNVARSPSGPLNLYKNLLFQMDARLAELITNQRGSYDRLKNPTHFDAFITIQNLRPGATGYGQYIWMNVPIYTTREAVSPPASQVDAYGLNLGTNMLIFSPGLAAYTNSSLTSLQWVHLGADILPFVKNAVNQALSTGVLKDPDLSHYYVGGFTIGWEVLGLDQATVQFKNVSLKVVR